MGHGTRKLKVGELARRSGLSVRSLRYYDQIGLLKPSGRSEGGHRLYEDARNESSEDGEWASPQ